MKSVKFIKADKEGILMKRSKIMKQSIKKLITLVLSLALVLGLSTTAIAAATDSMQLESCYKCACGKQFTSEAKANSHFAKCAKLEEEETVSETETTTVAPETTTDPAPVETTTSAPESTTNAPETTEVAEVVTTTTVTTVLPETTTRRTTVETKENITLPSLPSVSEVVEFVEKFTTPEEETAPVETTPVTKPTTTATDSPIVIVGMPEPSMEMESVFGVDDTPDDSEPTDETAEGIDETIIPNTGSKSGVIAFAALAVVAVAVIALLTKKKA